MFSIHRMDVARLWLAVLVTLVTAACTEPSIIECRTNADCPAATPICSFASEESEGGECTNIAILTTETSLDFELRPDSWEAARTISVQNVGTRVAGPFELKVTGPAEIVSSTCEGYLPPRSSCEVDVAVSGRAAGHYDLRLNLATPEQALEVSGVVSVTSEVVLRNAGTNMWFVYLRPDEQLGQACSEAECVVEWDDSVIRVGTRGELRESHWSAAGCEDNTAECAVRVTEPRQVIDFALDARPHTDVPIVVNRLRSGQGGVWLLDFQTGRGRLIDAGLQQRELPVEHGSSWTVPGKTLLHSVSAYLGVFEYQAFDLVTLALVKKVNLNETYGLEVSDTGRSDVELYVFGDDVPVVVVTGDWDEFGGKAIFLNAETVHDVPSRLIRQASVGTVSSEGREFSWTGRIVQDAGNGGFWYRQRRYSRVNDVELSVEPSSDGTQAYVRLDEDPLSQLLDVETTSDCLVAGVLTSQGAYRLLAVSPLLDEVVTLDEFAPSQIPDFPWGRFSVNWRGELWFALKATEGATEVRRYGDVCASIGG